MSTNLKKSKKSKKSKKLNHKKQAKKFCKKWQKKLKLQDWECRTSLLHPNDLSNKGAWGEIFKYDKWKVANISISNPKLVSDQNFDLELVIVHELLHIHFDEVLNKTKEEQSSSENRELERSIISITDSLIKLDRNPKKFKKMAKDTKSTRKQAKQLCKKWQKKLKLRDWECRIEIKHPNNLNNKGNWSEISPNAFWKIAYITLADPKLVCNPEVFDLELLIVQRLLNLHFYEILDYIPRNKMSSHEDRQLQRTITTIANVLIKLDRKVEKSKEKKENCEQKT